jgi:hypothetical protein
MTEPVQFLDPNSTDEKRAYGTTCSGCKHTFLLGYAYLQKDAHLEELRSEVARKGGLPLTAACPRDECSVTNSLALNRLIFVDDSAARTLPQEDVF